MNRTHMLLLLGAFLLLCTACVAPVAAHKAFVGAFMTGDASDEVMIRAWYEGGMPMANAEVTVYIVEDGEKEVYLEGVTDDQGFYSFEPEYKATQYNIKVEQTGHRAKMDLDLEGGVSTGSADAELPLAARIVAGFGYLIGLAGIGMIYTARRKNTQPKEPDNPDEQEG